jgi:hypothetical protein
MHPERCPVCADDVTCDAPTYTVNSDGTVTSSCCGLVWQREVTLDVFTWNEAKDYCTDLDLAGGGWRLPQIAELFSLVVAGQTPPEPTIDRVAFPNTPDALYYLSTTATDGWSAPAWPVDFTSGESGFLAVKGSSGKWRARCVRGGSELKR